MVGASSEIEDLLTENGVLPPGAAKRSDPRAGAEPDHDPDDVVCPECGQAFVRNADGTTNHIKEGMEPDYDADAGYVTF